MNSSLRAEFAWWRLQHQEEEEEEEEEEALIAGLVFAG